MTIQSTAAGLAALTLLAAPGAASAQDLAALEAAAKAEGMLTTIAPPHPQREFDRADQRQQEIERAKDQRRPGPDPSHRSHRSARARMTT